MSNTNTGGPAFPIERQTIAEQYGSVGMTLRDYFAAKAMPLAMNRLRENYNKDLGDEWAWENDDWESISEHAYKMADAMLKAREA